MLESKVETRLKRLENYGFKVLKLITPSYNGKMDRLILRPKYSPGAPSFVELKCPGKAERALQEAVRDDWRARGVIIHDMCDTIEKVDLLVSNLLMATGWEYNVEFSDVYHPMQKLGKLY